MEKISWTEKRINQKVLDNSIEKRSLLPIRETRKGKMLNHLIKYNK